MFKPKHVAPFFSLTPLQLSDILREIHIVYPLNQTTLGSFLISEKDLPVIELYINTKKFFGNKKLTRIQLKDLLEKRSTTEQDKQPDWIYMIRRKT